MTLHGTCLVIALTEGFADTFIAKVKSQKDFIWDRCTSISINIALVIVQLQTTDYAEKNPTPKTNRKTVGNFAFVLGGIGLALYPFLCRSDNFL